MNANENTRLLIYGAGVIGSLYAALFAAAGYDTALFARGRRLAQLQRAGLLYLQNGQVRRANVRVISRLEKNDLYHFIFLPVRETQVHAALAELKENISPHIVTMVNTLEDYGAWESICGSGRIIPAFPGAGGGFEGDTLKAALTPRLVQPTTFGEIDGSRTRRLSRLAEIFRHAGIPCQIVPDMHLWQLCHLAMVVPLADAYQEASHPQRLWLEKDVTDRAARRLHQNFQQLHRMGVRLSPAKLHLFRLLPEQVLAIGLRMVAKTQFADMFMYRHAMKAPDEMGQLHKQFYGYMEQISHRPGDI